MMQRHHTGSGRRDVIGPDRQDHGAAVATDPSVLDDHVAITVPSGEPVFDETLGRSVQPTLTLYTGPASVMQESPSDTEDAAGETVSDRTYHLTLTWGAPAIPENAIVTVTKTRDPDLRDRTLRVSGTQRGTRRFSRVHTCHLVT